MPNEENARQAWLCANKPRILTFDEVKENEAHLYETDGSYRPLIVEERSDVPYSKTQWVWSCAIAGYEKSEYGKTWRCWNKPPWNDSQKNTPWDD